MVLTARRKTCCVVPSPFTSILEEEPDITEDRRDSADSEGSLREELRISRAHWGRGVQLVNPLDGEFTLISSNNYDAFLAKVGAGPFSINLVQRARINMTITQVRRDSWSTIRQSHLTHYYSKILTFKKGQNVRYLRLRGIGFSGCNHTNASKQG